MKVGKVIVCIFMAALMTGSYGCNKISHPASSVNPSEQQTNPNMKAISIYPHRTDTWAGDPIPYYNEASKTYHIYYLEDLRDGDSGYHPWSLFQTKDFVSFTDKGKVIPYSKDTGAQDNALGTGSVIRDSHGIYHAFYTGHNGGLVQKEAIMQATSTDLLHWKKRAGWMLGPSANYSQTDFRDSAILYIKAKNEYWMLVTTRSQGKAVLARYTSTDLVNWKDSGIFFTSDMGDGNMECPTLVQFGSWWYLTFSEQSPNRVVHYRISQSPDGPFSKPAKDAFDGNGFYAGKTVTNGTQLYLCGWIPTRKNYDDNLEYDWAGSLAVHQLVQCKDGTLTCAPPKSLLQKLSNPSKPKTAYIGSGVTCENDEFAFRKPNSWILFQPWNKKTSVRITGLFQAEKSTKTFGFCFAAEKDGMSGLRYQVNLQKGTISFYNRSCANAKPESTVHADFSNVNSIPFTFLADDSACVLYMGGSALSSRMFSMPGMNWGIWSNDMGLTVRNLQAFT